MGNNMNKKVSMIIYCVLLLAILYCSFIVKADMLPLNPSPPNPSVDSIFYTSIVNYPVNLAFLAVISILFIKYGSYGKYLNISRKKLVIRLSIVAFIATIIGATIDGFLVDKPIYDYRYGYSVFYPSYSPDLTLDFIFVIIALALVFISFFLLSIIILKMNKKHALITGSIMTIFNAIFWYYIYITNLKGIGYAIFSIIFMIPISIIISVYFLIKLLYGNRRNTSKMEL